ncbi:AI-2E family transporter [Gilvimarinus sp. SDUM040013]|uniref:AI-2E family transporter n=1 Tax=Gilvimarinus gilvus TaxID=3058038 RepID=A0ABU4RZS0_9GAMM|nr:AI-2E family transporter [Gilvimarinus sp. SDUM040013]MDO3384787.1 AI-2E family transporter [Gilvimarinus sp. SDUM040013]MDX6850395.1 AI-2E family transporter [Gilvimarinus sp. SDUM040013]
MKTEAHTAMKFPPTIVDTSVRLGLIVFLVYLSMAILSPFLSLLLWAMILAIALYPLHAKITSKVGGSQSRAATLFVSTVVLIIGVPTVLLSISFVDHMLDIYKQLMDGSLQVPRPSDSVAGWPLIGERVDAMWREASVNLQGFMVEHHEQVRNYARKAVSVLGSAVTTLLAFLAAFIVAGIMLSYSKPGAESTSKIFRRICGAKVGDELHTLSVATVRSVAVGVVGVAFIQALLLGVGFLLAGIPAAGLLALAVLVFGIVQLPAAIFVIPVVAWLWMSGDGSLVVNILLTVYLIAAGLADNILKPIFLSRGVAAPMPVILLGALGGMFVSGLIGLFVGAVVLAVSYQVFMAWVNEGMPEDAEAAPVDAPTP